MVTMTSAAWAVSSVSGFGNSRLGSSPRSVRMATTEGLSWSPGSEPGRLDDDPALGVVVEEDPGRQAPPRVVDTEEEHGRCGRSVGPPRSG